MEGKNSLPPYAPPQYHEPDLPRPRWCNRRSVRRSRFVKAAALLCLGLIALSQWRQWTNQDLARPVLSTEKLNENLETCKKLRHKPKDPIGLGRDRNDRYNDGVKPTLIKNATIWIGEPTSGTSDEDARKGKGWEWFSGDVFLDKGLIQLVEDEIDVKGLPEETIVFDANGRILTSGIIDMHSHSGASPLPSLDGTRDENEMSDNITPWARSIDSIYPFDPQLQVIKSGGVTTSLILPGSGNNMGGEAYVIKHAVGKRDGRKEISAEDMLADPGREWRYMKMACGENAKRVHGRVGNRPFSRMGESYDFRHAFEQAAELNRKQDDWCAKADAVGVENMDEYLPQEIFWESLGAALRGQVHINTHCYTVPDLEAMVDHSNEFKFPIRAFHHAHQTFLVPEILKRTWGGRAPSSAIFSTNMWYKAESYIGSEFAGKHLYDEGLTPIYVSDNPVLNAQHVLFEAAKGYHFGLPYHAALASVTTAPADDLGMGERIGKVKPGFDADVAVWDSDPLSVGAAPVQVWIDGAAQFDDPVELIKLNTGPQKIEESLQDVVEEPTETGDAVITGITKVFLSDKDTADFSSDPVSAVIRDGRIVCLGTCRAEVKAASDNGLKTLAVQNGYLVKPLTAVAGTLGLNEIDAETSTDNGANPDKFTRAVDGLMLESKKLLYAKRYGVTRAISAPKFTGGKSHHGVSTGFFTGAHTALDKGAVFADDVAVHFTLNSNILGWNSYTAAFGELRHKLIKAATSADETKDPFSEDAYLKKVLDGSMTLALTIHSADGIASALRVKSDVDALLSKKSSGPIKLAILGGAEAHLVAEQLASAHVGVILSELQPLAEKWDSRRALTGAPLTNGTVIDHLVAAGVKVAIGVKEDWHILDLMFSAGIAYRNGGGKLDEKQALNLVSDNALDILGVKAQDELDKEGDFIVYEGSPLEISGRIRGVGSRGKLALWV